jgi:L-fuculose-phosphate aldolase
MGRPCSQVTEDDIPVVGFDLEPVEGELAPSSEALLHVGVYIARPDVRAVIHTHPIYAGAAAVAGLRIPPIIDEMVVAIGGGIEVSEYAFPGTQQLADNVLAALGERNAALLRNHGAVESGAISGRP